MSSALASAPSPTMRCSRRCSRSVDLGSAMRGRAGWPASMRCASSRSSSPVSRSTRPISLRYMRTVSDVPPSPRSAGVPSVPPGRRLSMRERSPSLISGRAMPLVGVTASSSTSSSTAMPACADPARTAVITSR